MHTPPGKEETSIASEIRPASECTRAWAQLLVFDISSRYVASLSCEKGNSSDNPEWSAESLSCVELPFPTGTHRVSLRKARSARLLEETELGVLLARSLNRHVPAESTCPLTNRPIQPRLIHIAPSEETQTVTQKNQLNMRRRLTEEMNAAGRLCTLRSLKSAFTRDAHRAGKRAKSRNP